MKLNNILMIIALVLVLVFIFKMALFALPYLLIGAVVYFAYKAIKGRL